MASSRDRRTIRRLLKEVGQWHPPEPPVPLSHPNKPIWKSVAKWVYAALGGVGLLIAYAALWPQLSITQDFSFDPQNVFNTSFSVFNEGLLPLTNLSVTCTGGFTMRSADNQLVVPLGTSTDYPNFYKRLTYKRRMSLPCNHNVVANGHPLDPGATLGIRIHYRILGLPISRPQTFNF
jgi:hypothetical protein